MENKIELPIPEDAKWEAVGRGYATVLMDKQRRIDELEQMISCLHDNICRNVRSTAIVEDTEDYCALMCDSILARVNALKEK